MLTMRSTPATQPGDLVTIWSCATNRQIARIEVEPGDTTETVLLEVLSYCRRNCQFVADVAVNSVVFATWE